MMAPETRYQILIADDEPAITEGLSAMLEEEGYSTESARDGHEALKKLKERSFHLALVDLKIPGKDGLQILDEIKKQNILTEVIIITGKGTIDTAVQAMKAGAYDYLTKPVEPQRLRSIIPKALERHQLIVDNQQLKETIRNLTRYDQLIGQHEKMRKIYEIIDAVAESTANILITGESGTGKELVARAIHNKSPRAGGPFLAVNCSALPRDILENELFGHEKGAFTGALKEKPGCFEMAHGGTLFLDEIGEMPVDTQAKLLRVLESQSFRRLGGTREIQVDVRLIAATNRKVQKALTDGLLREDLYYRLSVVEIELPPLRERMSDLPLLVEEFLKMYNQKNNKDIKGFSKECWEVFHNYSWPGNVRELKNVVERAVILCPQEIVQLEHLPGHLLVSKETTVPKKEENIALGKTLYEIEKEIIYKTLKMTNNNKTRAAQVLGISLKTLHNKLNRYMLEEKIKKA